MPFNVLNAIMIIIIMLIFCRGFIERKSLQWVSCDRGWRITNVEWFCQQKGSKDCYRYVTLIVVLLNHSVRTERIQIIFKNIFLSLTLYLPENLRKQKKFWLAAPFALRLPSTLTVFNDHYTCGASDEIFMTNILVISMVLKGLIFRLNF